MAMSIRGILKNNLKFLSNSILKPVSNNTRRSMFSASYLAVDSYADSRKSVFSQFDSVADSFRAKMIEFSHEDNKNIIFTEDLKAMLHLIENNEADIDLIMKMMRKFHSQNNELRFGTYVFGPVVMRAFYYLNLPDVAKQAFCDPQLQGFFDQLTSYQVFLTLLYNNEKYSDMREIYDMIKIKYTGGVMHPQNSVILVLAGCYKENTPESFKYALDLWKELQNKGFDANRKMFCLISALAIKQEKPDFAIELLASCPQFRHIDVRCTKIQAYIDMKRLNQLAKLISSMMNDASNNENRRAISFFKDTIENIEKAIQIEGEEKHGDLLKLINELRSQNLVQEITLEDSLLRVIDKRRIDSNSSSAAQSKSFRTNGKQRSAMKF